MLALKIILIFSLGQNYVNAAKICNVYLEFHQNLWDYFQTLEEVGSRQKVKCKLAGCLDLRPERLALSPVRPNWLALRPCLLDLRPGCLTLRPGWPRGLAGWSWGLAGSPWGLNGWSYTVNVCLDCFIGGRSCRWAMPVCQQRNSSEIGPNSQPRTERKAIKNESD